MNDKEIAARLNAAGAKSLPKKRTAPLWKGPEEDGITFSLLSRFLVCRERFRLLVVEGLRPAPAFNHRIEFGSMWHVCEEAHADGGLDWNRQLQAYCSHLAQQYPTSRQQVEHWCNVCKVTFPVYVDYWSDHPDTTDRTPLLQEQVFDVPYQLPSGRTVRLRGKWDGVDLISQGKTAGIYLFETKTKGDVREGQIRRQLNMDLQTMLYLVALQTDWAEVMNHVDSLKKWSDLSGPSGIRYNVVRRPLSGGKGTIVQHKPTKSKPFGESAEAFYQRLQGIIAEDPGYYFTRWRSEVSPADVKKFREQCLDPILEQLCLWYDWVVLGKVDPDFMLNVSPTWRHPFGVWNPLDEGGSSDLDEYLENGSEVGLHRTENLFPELT
jgi:hypothetical protein